MAGCLASKLLASLSGIRGAHATSYDWVRLATAIGTRDVDGHLWAQAQVVAPDSAALCSQHIHQWWFLGPFPCSMSEMDGDPVAALGGPNMVARNQQVYSELVLGGEVSWQLLPHSRAGEVLLQPSVDWNDLMGYMLLKCYFVTRCRTDRHLYRSIWATHWVNRSLGSLAVIQWQGWVMGEFALHQPAIIHIQCPVSQTLS